MEQLTHDIGNTDENWNESYYLVFYDKENEIGGMSRVGFKPNKPEGMTFFFIFLPDGSVGAYHLEDNAGNYPENLAVGGVTHKPLRNGSWKFLFEGPLIILDDSRNLPKVSKSPEVITDLLGGKIELQFSPINEPYEYSEHMTTKSLELGKKSGDKHWEQIAQVSGNIRIGEKEYIVEKAMAQRDHTHGIRDWTGVGNWFYFVVWFGPNLAINPAAIVTDDGELGSGGFLFRDGKNIPLIEITLKEHKFEEDGAYPIKTVLELTDANGNYHILEAEPGRIIPVPFTERDGRESILIQSFGKFKLDEITGGYGSYEILRRLDS
ncbi:hypothetical protein EU537_04505 [Candidatus Thorarchaeota archaeon]|nr:MAG: hypothetical protein EU537_04505 [Candidatus Thorarchaeota archaeon]